MRLAIAGLLIAVLATTVCAGPPPPPPPPSPDISGARNLRVDGDPVIPVDMDEGDIHDMRDPGASDLGTYFKLNDTTYMLLIYLHGSYHLLKAVWNDAEQEWTLYKEFGGYWISVGTMD